MESETKTIQKNKVEITTSDPKLLSELITQISNLIVESNILFTESSMIIKSMDKGSVAMVVLNLDKSVFDTYKIEGETEQSYGVDLVNLKKLLKSGTKIKKMILLFEDKNNIKLTFVKENDKEKTFGLPIIDIKVEEKNLPQFAFETTFEIDIDSFNEMLTDVGLVGGSVRFIIENDKVIVNSKGDSSSVNIDLEIENLQSIKKKVEALYSNEYLGKTIFKNKKAKVGLGTEYPIKIEYNEEGYNLIYVVAPRTENY